jgi:Leucine-rich repeat (LRR) protein
MKQILLILAAVALAGCGKKVAVDKKPLTQSEVIEWMIRFELKKPTGELTKTDLEKVERLILNWGPNSNRQQLSDLTGLENLTQLTVLRLGSNQLTDVKGLEKLTQLTTLQLNDNQLTDVKGLENLTQLKTLGLRGNQLTDVKGLENLTQLKELYLGGNKLTDVASLENLMKLETLYLEDNPDLTKAQIDELQKALPKCDISSNPAK